MIYNLSLKTWQGPIDTKVQQQALTALESGQVLFLPNLTFSLEKQEEIFFSPSYVHPKKKNISYQLSTNQLKGVQCTKSESSLITSMMARYALSAQKLLENLLPPYQEYANHARTSYRPVEIAGRKPPSYRKDDTRLHVDAFPASPTRGHRILRVFTNINPHGKPRIWRLGSPFHQVVEYFANHLKKPYWGSRQLLHTFKITRGKRTAYDHYMLQLHNAMKKDTKYQEQVEQLTFEFPTGSTWIVYTDQVSHAAMAGQFALEQTYYLPPTAIVNPVHSPLKVLQGYFGENLL